MQQDLYLMMLMLRGLCYGIDSAFTLWRKPSQWESVIVNAMEQDFSWQTSAKGYPIPI